MTLSDLLAFRESLENVLRGIDREIELMRTIEQSLEGIENLDQVLDQIF